ncbi:putative E3 ubiquitin-protein ligase UNKL isoform X2 [Tamandua tetradactyla]|uniref:putative E3 ubiquitin-protein ligase UNKL isoform X2 n=1 Tax=Tamandua tetradactyla TaxID=48850 RepID=UPI004053D431
MEAAGRPRMFGPNTSAWGKTRAVMGRSQGTLGGCGDAAVLTGPALGPRLSEFSSAQGEDSGALGLAGQRLLGGSAPVTVPGAPACSPAAHSSSPLSTSPLSSLSQSLSGTLVSAMTPPLTSEPGVLGSSASSYSSLGLSGVPGSIWDCTAGGFSPSPSPVLSAGPVPPSASPCSSELARVRLQLDEARRKIQQWEESWQQVKQACDAWQREAREAKERARVADSDRQLALHRKEEAEARFKALQEELEGLGVAAAGPALRGLGDIEAIPLAELHLLQSQLRLDLEAVDGVSHLPVACKAVCRLPGAHPRHRPAALPAPCPL